MYKFTLKFYINQYYLLKPLDFKNIDGEDEKQHSLNY